LGDFNLIRSHGDKSSGGGDQKLIDLFNGFIGKFDLREVFRMGGKFTWTNKKKILCAVILIEFL